VWPRWLTDAFRGKDSLARAFWLWGVGVSVAYSLVGALIDVDRPIALTVYLVFGLALGVLQTVILWRCATNSRSSMLRRLVRAAVIGGLVIVVLMLYVVLTNPSLLMSPNLRWSGL
jgi:FtsH-binding integral membrane protein